MNRTIFESMFSVNQVKSSKRWLFFPISLVFHFLVIGAVIAVPLMNAEGHLPEMKVTQVFLTAPLPPQPPGPPKGKSGSGRAGKRVEKRNEKPKPVNRQPTTFIAPPEVPQEIQEEEWVVPGDGGGGYDGPWVPGGVDFGEPNPIFIKKVDPNAQSVPISRVELPRLIKRVAPHYPEVARKAKVQGTVELQAVTDIYGKVVNVRVSRGHMLLRSAALQAVKQWIYEPYVINGLPKPVTFSVEINFILHR